MPKDNSPKTDSLHRQSPYSGNAFGGTQYDFACSCGNRWIGKSSTCSNCGGMAKSHGEMTRKMDDAPDLIK